MTRIEIERLVLNSGIFKLNDKGLPEGVFQLQPNKSLSAKHVSAKEAPSLNVRYFENNLTQILFKYFNSPPPESLNKATKEAISEIEKGFSLILSDYFKPDEIKTYSKKLIGRKFKKEIESKLEATGAFENKKADKKYFKLLEPLFQEIRKQLNKHETDTYYYLCHFLIGCNIETGEIKTVFKRISKYISRYEGNPESAISLYRKDPHSFIDIP